VEVILLKDVEKVGLRGDVVNVARGYMRNYLEPRKLAEAATPALLAEHQKREENRARHEAKTLEQAQEIAAKLGGVELRFERSAGPRGRLFGSVTPTDIADEIWATQRVRVDRRKIELEETIKRVGQHTVSIRIFEDVDAEVRTLVIPEGGELPSEAEVAAWEAEERAEEEPEEHEVEGAEELEALLAEEEPVAEAAEGEELPAAEGEEPAAEAEDAEGESEPAETEEPDAPEGESEEAEASEPEADEASSEEPAADPAEEPAS
jgi:large subunit ribosomal protein L9